MCVTLKKGSDWLKLYVEIWWVWLCFLDICFDQFVLKTDCEDESFFGNIFGQYVLKRSSRRPEDILSRRIFSWIFIFPINLKGALKTCLFLTVSERIFFAVICFKQYVLKMSLRPLSKVKISANNSLDQFVFNTFWRHFQKIIGRRRQKTSSSHFYKVEWLLTLVHFFMMDLIPQ